MSDILLYIDPTSAGLGLQMLLAGAVGGLVSIRLFWGHVLSDIPGCGEAKHRWRGHERSRDPLAP